MDAKISDGFYEAVGERLRANRKKAGMDQETLSEYLSLSRTSIINIEKGRQRISLEQAWMAASVLGITITELLPPAKPKSIDEWTSKINPSEVSEKARKVVIGFISKAKAKKQ